MRLRLKPTTGELPIKGTVVAYNPVSGEFRLKTDIRLTAPTGDTVSEIQFSTIKNGESGQQFLDSVWGLEWVIV